MTFVAERVAWYNRVRVMQKNPFMMRIKGRWELNNRLSFSTKEDEAGGVLFLRQVRWENACLLEIGKGSLTLRAGQVAHQSGAYPVFCSIKQLGLFLPPVLTPWWIEAPLDFSVLRKNAAKCPRQGLESGKLDPETKTLTTRSPCLPI